LTPNAPSCALLFRQFDDRKSGRTSPDVSGAYQGLYPALRGVQGIVWHHRYIEGVPVPSGDGIYSIFREKGSRTQGAPIE
jgi:hypothetical protein